MKFFKVVINRASVLFFYEELEYGNQGNSLTSAVRVLDGKERSFVTPYACEDYWALLVLTQVLIQYQTHCATQYSFILLIIHKRLLTLTQHCQIKR